GARVVPMRTRGTCALRRESPARTKIHHWRRGSKPAMKRTRSSRLPEPMRRARSSGWRLLRRLRAFFVAAGGVGTDGDGEGAPGAVEPIELIQGTRVPLRPSQRPYR